MREPPEYQPEGADEPDTRCDADDILIGIHSPMRRAAFLVLIPFMLGGILGVLSDLDHILGMPRSTHLLACYVAIAGGCLAVGAGLALHNRWLHRVGLRRVENAN